MVPDDWFMKKAREEESKDMRFIEMMIQTYTADHVNRTDELCEIIGKELKYSGKTGSILV